VALKDESILVVGAGASGLAFALECLQSGIEVRIIDKRPCKSRVAKATGVAQSVWNQLEAYGVCPNALNAIPMQHFAFYDDNKLVSNVTVPLINKKPPAYLYPQHMLEDQLENELNKKGLKIEYGIGFHSIRQNNQIAEVHLSHIDSGNVEVCCFKWVIGADGAHSSVRRSLGVAFVGKDYPEQWSAAEIRTKQWPPIVQAKLDLQSNGVGLFLSQASLGVVQGILNSKGVGGKLKERFSDAELIYERKFNVSLRRVITPKIACFWLIGDAAHVQSPVGGQGLNLAIWDGITLAKALINNDLSVAKKLSTRAKKVLFFTDFDYKMLATKHNVVRYLRNTYWSFAGRYPVIAHWFFKIISGV
jgi:2-polyprenyl-6-methoxyphenol hydroxylase-like FAD-dependent oxidoreductase